MSAESCSKVRLLPDGPVREAREVRWTGHLLDLEVAVRENEPELHAGALVEIESGPKLYLGVVEQSRGAALCVSVEHALDRDALEWIQDAWG